MSFRQSFAHKNGIFATFHELYVIAVNVLPTQSIPYNCPIVNRGSFSRDLVTALAVLATARTLRKISFAFY